MAESVEDLARRAYDAINRRDLDAFLELIDPEVEFRSLIAESEGGAFRGHDGVRRWWDRVRESLGGLRYELEEIHAIGDGGYSRIKVVATTHGVEVPQVMFQAFRLREGKVYWWDTVRSEPEAIEALGGKPTES